MRAVREPIHGTARPAQLLHQSHKSGWRSFALTGILHHQLIRLSQDVFSPEHNGVQVLCQRSEQLLQAVRRAQHGGRGRGRAGGSRRSRLLLRGLALLVASGEDATVASAERTWERVAHAGG